MLPRHRKIGTVPAGSRIGSQFDAPPLAHLGRALGWTCFALVALAGLLVAIRRTTGALAGPLHPGLLLVWSSLLAAAALAFRRALPRPAFLGSEWASGVLWATPSAVLLLWATGLSVDATAAGLVAFWGVLVLEEGGSWRSFTRRYDAGHPASPPGPHLARPLPTVEQPLGTLLVDEGDSGFDPAVSQQVVRRREKDGAETMTGWISADVAAGSRHATAHVAICPPFGGTPECFAEQMDGPSARIKIAQVLPHGVRFEIKLDEPAEEPSRVIVEFSIRQGVAEP